MTLAIVQGSVAHAVTVNRCLARKIGDVGASVAARTRCDARYAATHDADARERCASMASGKFMGHDVPDEGAFESAEQSSPCVTYDDQALFEEAIGAFTTSLALAVAGAGEPSACDAAKLKCVGKYVLASARCHAKAATTGTLDTGCLVRAALRLSNGVNGCLDKAAALGGCTTHEDTALLEVAAEQFLAAVLCTLDPADRPGCAPVPTATVAGPTPHRTSTTVRPTPTRTATRTRTPTPQRTPTPVSTSGGDPAQLCVDTINEYRASIGLPPYARWTAAEDCADAQALADGQAQTPHKTFGQCGEFGQNACVGFGTPSRLIGRCLQLMWNEGPGSGPAHGHYNAMASRGYSKVACGFATLPNGETWATQDYR